jgi:hypothetical protein
MSFLRRNKKEEAPPPPPPTPVQEDVSAQQYALKLNYLARSSDGLRMQADPAVRAMLPGIVEPLAISHVEVIEPLPYDEDTAEFHAAFRAACMGHNPTYYDKFRKWADEYFFIPHRQVSRGVGGIFYDHLECTDEPEFERNFAFTRDVGEAFLDVFPKLVRRRMGTAWSEADKQQQLEWRGRYAEFNLVYDRGTLFGLRTGGNIDAILMSLPPEATWN